METLFVGRNLIFLPQTESTNSYAISLLKNVNTPEGSVVHTAFQSHGKGQRGNSWLNEKDKDLAASFILHPAFLQVDQQFILYQIAALACHDLLAQILHKRQDELKIKWPNDILLNEKKICGILIENVISGNRISHSVIGIGINVNSTGFPPPLKATSIRISTGKDYPVNEVLEKLCSALEKYYLMLKNHKPNKVQEMYMDRMYGLNEQRDFETGGRKQKMKVMGLGNTGLLLLENEKGKQSEFDVKEVKWI